MEVIWHYLINQFLSATAGNYKKALKLSNYHDAYLLKMLTDNPADPDWSMLYNRYHPFHELFVAEYTKWKTAGGIQKGQTLNLDQLLLLLISKVSRWDVQLQNITDFEKGTTNYTTIFPQGHKPLTKGAKTARINAVKVLGENMTSFALTNPAIALLKSEIDTYYTTIDTARDTQEGAKGGTQQKSEQVETKRIDIAIEQYRDLGYLMNKGAETPLMIAPFFELQVLREHDQVLFTGILDPGENEAILIHSFVSDDELELEITGGATVPSSLQIAFYLSTTPGGTNSTPVYVQVNNGKLLIQASAFGISNWGTHRHLTAINNSASEVHYKVELL